MDNLSIDQIKQVCDEFSIGVVLDFFPIGVCELLFEDSHIKLNRIIIFTSHGGFILIFSENDNLHDFWWNSKKFDWEKRLKEVVKVKYSQVKLTQNNHNNVHKFDKRFYLLEI